MGSKPRKSMSTGKRSAQSGIPSRSKSTSMSGFERSRTTGGLVQPSDELLAAIKQLSAKSGHPFQISTEPVPGTSLFVVHTPDHAFRAEYTVTRGVLGFRAPFNFPDAAPEGAFFVIPVDIKLLKPDPVRN